MNPANHNDSLSRQDAPDQSLIHGSSLPAAAPLPGHRPEDSCAGQDSPPLSRPLVDLTRIVDALVGKWYWLVTVGVVLGIIGFRLGFSSAPYTATVQLIRVPNSFASTPIDPAQTASSLEHPTETMISLLRSPAFLNAVIARSGVPVTADYLASNSELVQIRNGDLITIRLRGTSPERTVKLINSYADETVHYASELRRRDLAEMDRLVRDELFALDAKIAVVDRELIQLQEQAGKADLDKDVPMQLGELKELQARSDRLRKRGESLDSQIEALMQEIGRQTPALVSAREALAQALLHYTAEHPKVKELRAAVASLEAQIEHDIQTSPRIVAAGNPVVSSVFLQVIDLRKEKINLSKQLDEIQSSQTLLQNGLAQSAGSNSRFSRAKAQRQVLAERRATLARKAQELQFLAENGTDSHKLLSQAKVADLSAFGKTRSAILFGSMAALLGLFGAGALLLLFDISDSRVRSVSDLRRITRLPNLGTLGNLGAMTDEAKTNWAFSTFVLLRSKLLGARAGGMICGFTSSGPGEGRTTCVRLLADAASRQGYSVLTIAATAQDLSVPDQTTPPAEANTESESSALAIDLSAVVAAPRPQSVVHLPIPGLIWNLEQRQKLGQALAQWSAIDNLVVLVDLPPASVPESALLSGNLPALVWICGKDMTDAPQTRSQIEILGHCRDNLVGTIFNRDDRPRWKKRFDHLVGAALLALGLIPGNLFAQQAAVPPPRVSPATNKSPAALSVSSPSQMAEWQRRLTLGPGDVLDLSLYDQPDSLRPGLVIGPDGRLNYLQARDFVAAGLTVEELRSKLEDTLGKFYLSPRVIAVPVSYNSKKYILLGNVVQTGVFPLDRPLTIVEAIAKAQGFQIALQQSNVVVTADLQKSFLVRKQADGKFQRLPVDFEALFRGDLAQNQVVAPDDFMYFPPLGLREVYVVGEVLRPGIVPYTDRLTTIGAIAARGGFTERAYKSKILIVRGSLNAPETYVLNASEVLTGKSLDFKLMPKDIIFVSHRPWIIVEDIVTLAVTDFLRAMVITYGGQRISTLTQPIF